MGRHEGKRELFVCQCGNNIVCEESGCNQFAVEDDYFESSFCDYHTDEAYKQEEADREVHRRLEDRAINEEIDKEYHESKGMWS